MREHEECRADHLHRRVAYQGGSSAHPLTVTPSFVPACGERASRLDGRAPTHPQIADAPTHPPVQVVWTLQVTAVHAPQSK